MPWFKVDDSLTFHPKMMGLSAEAGWLWTRAGAWCAQQLTDGRVPARLLFALGATEDAAQELVDAGLWIPEDGGWRFHDWLEYQPSREAVEAERVAARERQRRAREKAKEAREQRDSPSHDDDDLSRRESRRDSRVNDGVSHGPPDPTRPDPSLKHLSSAHADDRFEEWWDAYNYKVGKKDAKTKWLRALAKKGVTADLLIEATVRYIAHLRSQGKHPKFTKLPTTWLNGEHWDDELPGIMTNPDPWAHVPHLNRKPAS